MNLSTIPQRHIDKMCHSKRVFVSVKECEHFLRMARKKGIIISSTFHYYKCGFCPNYHFGHSKGKND